MPKPHKRSLRVWRTRTNAAKPPAPGAPPSDPANPGQADPGSPSRPPETGTARQTPGSEPVGQAATASARERGTADHARFTVMLQLMLAVSLGVLTCSLLGSSVLVGAALVCVSGAVGGLLLRAQRRLALSLAAVIMLVGLTTELLRPSVGLPIVAVVLAGLAVTPAVLSRRSGRLLVPVALSLAGTVGAVAVTFDTAPPPPDNLAMWMQEPSGRIQPSVSIVLTINFRGCSQPVTAWLAYTSSPAKTDLLEGVLARDQPHTIPTDTMPVFTLNSSPRVLFRHYPLLDPRPRGVGSCYLTIPSFDDFDLEQRYADHHEDALGYDALDNPRSETDLNVDGATLSVARGFSPTVSGEPSRWMCAPGSGPGDESNSPLNGVSDAGGCDAVLALTDPWYGTFQGVMLLVIGALFAVVLTLVGRAADGFGLFNID